MEGSEHATIKIEATAPQSIRAGAASPAANSWMAILRAGFRDKVLTTLAGSNAKTLYGRLVELHLDRVDRLDSMGPIGTSTGYMYVGSRFGRTVLLRFWWSGATPRRNSDRVCADLQPVL